MTTLIALNGRALFNPDDVAFDVDATETEERGPYFAWMLFTWKVNEMVPEVFVTKGTGVTLHEDTPAKGWFTEEYERARIILPPNPDNMIMIQADDVRLWPVWDQAMQTVVSGNIHQH